MKADNGDAHVKVDDKTYSPPEISSMILQKLKADAEAYLGDTIKEAVITADASGPKHLQMSLTRAKLEQLTSELLDRTNEPINACLKDADMPPEKVAAAVLVGGQTRMPKVREFVQELFQKEPHKGVNPDEVVAIGAAVQAGVMSGDVEDVLLLDVTPLTLGIETQGGVFTKLIERNTTIPTQKSEIFSTAEDNQTAVDVHVLQGEREMAKDNKSIGRFRLDGIPPAPRGVPQIEVTFDIDANGILNVSAKDLGTGKEQKITITASSGLDKDEVDRMVREARDHAAEDRRKREQVETRNKGESALYATERTLEEHADKISQDGKARVESALGRLREALKGEDANEIQAATDAVNEAMQNVSSELYSQTQAEQQQGQGPAGAGAQEGGGTQEQSESDEDVIDAEYSVDDDQQNQ